VTGAGDQEFRGNQGGSRVLQFIVVGLVLGSIYALAASGLVITYVSTGVLNFAFGALAYLIARTYYYLHVEQQWGIMASAAMCLLVVAPALGLFLYMAIFRFLRLSSQLIKVVVTIGLSVTIPALATMIFGNDEIFQAPGLAPTPVSVYHVFNTAVTLDQVIAYGCVIGIVVIGALILRFTEAGLSVRAMVDSEAMTSLSGSNPSRIAAGVWVVGTFLAGLAGILAAPVIGLDAGKFTLLIAAAFAAVIAARLRSLPIAVIVALLMGIAGSLVQYYLPPDSEVTANIIPSIPFAFVVVSLIYNIIRSGRVNEEEGVGGALDRAITPNGGSRLAASTDSENLYPKLNFWFPVGIFAFACVLPLIFKPYWLGLFGTGITLAIVFLAYTLVTGEGGMLWLCQITFAGVGALATGQLATEHGWPVLLAIVAGGAIAAAIGVVIGLLTIRLGNLYVALVTLTFGLLMEKLVFNLKDFSQFGAGVAINRPEFAVSDRVFAYVALAFFAVIAILIVNLRRSTTGLALNAVRWSENASRTMGLSVIQMKMLVSGLAAFVAGVGGGLYAVGHKQAIPLDYVTLAGLAWLAVLVTFGVRSNIAALLAGCIFVLSPAFIQTVLQLQTPWSELPILLFGLGAIALAQNPEGTVHMWAMGFQRNMQRLSGARAVPAATAYAGRHDPRLEGDAPPGSPPAPQPDERTAEVAGP
jgi:branched-chain amino acid transport system permease protein